MIKELCRTEDMSAEPVGFKLLAENHVADAFLTEEHHARPISADARAAGGRHAMFEGDKEIFVELLLFAAGPVLQSLALSDRIVLLGSNREIHEPRERLS